MANNFGATLQAIFGNGRGEAGLEVGADPGLPLDHHVRIPRSMIKPWCVRLMRPDKDDGKEVQEAYKKGLAATFKAQPKKTDKGKEKATDEDAVVVEDWDEANGPEYYQGKKGWVTAGEIVIHNGWLWIPKETFGTEIDLLAYDFHISPMTEDDIANFVVVNTTHINDAEFDEQTKLWIHAIRFWATGSGFVRTSTSKEYIITDNPTNVPESARVAVGFIAEYSANAWTACAARAASWRKTNHATGGAVAAGFPRRWLQKMGYIVPHQDRTENARIQRNATSAFYVATHAASVHAVLSLMAEDDSNHWAKINPSSGFIPDWEVHESAKIRMRPNTQVAGAAMVTDSVVVLKMLVREGLVPLLVNLDQVDALVNAHSVVVENGVRVAE